MASCARVLPDCDARCARRLAPTMGRSSLHSYRSSCGDHLLCASMNSAAPPSLGLTSVCSRQPAAAADTGVRRLGGLVTNAAPTVRAFSAGEWHVYRDLRLRALADSPDAF